MEKIMDLHTHSIYSDGNLTPEEIVREASKRKIGVLAITDHDNIEGSKELVKLSHKDILVYSGVELTAKANKGRMHILGYNLDLDNEELNRVLDEQKRTAIYNLLLYIDILRRNFNLKIPNDEIDEIIKSKGNVGRPQLALLLIKLGYVKDVEEAFKKYLIYAYERVRKVKKGLTKEECIDLINKASGIAILAHPNSLKMELNELKDEIKYLKSLGLQGIETIHSNLNIYERKAYHSIALEEGLLESGGTDFHGYEAKPDIELGTGRKGNVLIPVNSLTLTKKINSRYK